MTKTNNTKPRLRSIIIGVPDVEKAKKFYVSVFEIEIESQSENYVSAYLNDTHIELEENSPNRFPNWIEHNVGTYKNCEFSVDNINAFLKKVVAHGGKVISKPILRPWGNYTAEIADPDGNMFLISEGHKK